MFVPLHLRNKQKTTQMKQLKTIQILLLGILIFSSCKDNSYEEFETESRYKDFPGKYEITAMESAQLIDLKGDGISSTNL